MRWDSVKVEFTKSGRVRDDDEQAAAVDLAQAGATDVLLVAHGWNNDISQAEELFAELCDNAAALQPQRAPNRTFAVVRLLWPSVRWADEDQRAGGGVSAGDDTTALLDAIAERVQATEARRELVRLAGLLDGSGQARAEFVEVLRRLLPRQNKVDDDDPLPPALRTGAVEELFQRVAEAERSLDDDGAPRVPGAGGPPGVYDEVLTGTSGGGAAGLGDLGVSMTRLARRLLNTTTYYTMKARAGDVGRKGVAPLLDALHDAAPQVRLHLAGHSFGARVVSAAAHAATAPVTSMTLLQAAFSHHAFSASNVPPGAFREVLSSGRLRGPLVVTHTHNDRAVRHAYAVASFVAGQVAADLGDADSPYGGLGANGAVATAEAVRGSLGDADAVYDLRPGCVHNLLADAEIQGHGDVRDRAVANVLVQAMAAAT